jgi:putative ABC transport system permease protein
MSAGSRQQGFTLAGALIVLAVAGAVFAAVEVQTIDRGQAAVSWARVGADYRVDAGEDGLPPGAREAAGREAEAVAAAWVERRARVVTGGAGTLGGFTLLALEPERYAAVTSGTPVSDGLLAGEEEARPIPAVVSGRPVPGATIEVDRPLTVEVQGDQIELVAVERRERIAGMPATEPVVAVPLGAVRSALGERIVRPNRLYVRAGTSAGEALREALPQASVLGRRDVHRSLGASPLAAGTVDGFRAAVLVGGALAALAVLLAAALTARARAREVAYLRALGLSGRQALALVAFELVPATVVALAVGISLGIAVPHVLAPGVDLTAFTGAEPVITVDPAPVALLAGSVLAALGVAVVLAGGSARRTELGRALRAEER